MKKLLLIVLLLPVIATAQDSIPKLPVDSTTHLVTFLRINNVPGVTKAELYARAREWFAVTFSTANKVLQMDDKENGKLVGRGSLTSTYTMKIGLGMTMPSSYIIDYTINITIKDFKYRIIITDFQLKNTSSNIESSIENVLLNVDAYQHKKLSRIMKEITKSQIQALWVVNNQGGTIIESCNAGMISPKKDDF